VLAANLVLGVDGRWGTLDSRRLYHHARTAGYLYQAELRAELVERLGVHWQLVRRGTSELDGIPPSVLREFSRRRSAIERQLDERGTSSRGAAQHAALTTRLPKDLTVDLTDLRTDWQQRAAALGFGPANLEQALHRPVRVAGSVVDEAGLAAGLTWDRSTFDRRDVLRGLAEQARAGAHTAGLETACDRFLAGPSVVAVNEAEWTTREILHLEASIIRSALERQAGGYGVAEPGAALAATELSDEQRAVIEQLTTSGNGVDVVVGVAGAGKTHALRAAVQAWTDAGYPVVGTALAARAADELERATGVPSRTLASLVQAIDRHGPDLVGGHVLLVDEAAMIGTRHLARLLTHADTAGAKVVLVGDHRQLPEIEAGGAFATLTDTLHTVPLLENRRQHDSVERHALHELRTGEVDRALTLLGEHGRIVSAASAPELRERLVDDWLSARTDGLEAVMLAERNTDVDQLNQLARDALQARGLLPTAQASFGGRGFSVGDEVMALRNDARLDILNGERGIVASIDEHAQRLAVRSERDGNAKVLPAHYLEAGLLTHAYAMTIHKAQGMTCDVALTLASDTIYREAAYTALSRGRAENRLYLADPEPPRVDLGHAPELDDDSADDWIERALQRSKAKTTAISHAEPDVGIEIEI
jgi:hypothetical protein